jgi:putative hydrolase of the HAD superfamily
MSLGRIKVVVFDIGKVLVDYDNLAFCQNFSDIFQKEPREIYQKIIRSKLVNHFMKGEILAGDFYASVMDMFRVDSRIDFNYFEKTWNGIFAENQEIKESILNKLKPELDLMILSNTNHLHWEFISNNFSVIQDYFLTEKDNLILSFVEGLIKPEEEIFLKALNCQKAEPENFLYIDDSFANCKKFRQLGGNSILYNCSCDSIEFLTQEFQKYGVLA